MVRNIIFRFCVCLHMLILSLSDDIGFNIWVDCSRLLLFQTCFARGLKLAISTITSQPRRSPSRSGFAWGDQTHLLEVKRKLTNQILTFYLHSTNMKLSIFCHTKIIYIYILSSGRKDRIFRYKRRIRSMKIF